MHFKCHPASSLCPLSLPCSCVNRKVGRWDLHVDAKLRAECSRSHLCVSGVRGTQALGSVLCIFPSGSLCCGVISEGCFFAFSFDNCDLMPEMMKSSEQGVERRSRKGRNSLMILVRRKSVRQRKHRKWVRSQEVLGVSGPTFHCSFLQALSPGAQE